VAICRRLRGDGPRFTLSLLRLSGGSRAPEPSAAILDARSTLQSTPESGHRGGWDGHKRQIRAPRRSTPPWTTLLWDTCSRLGRNAGLGAGAAGSGGRVGRGRPRSDRRIGGACVRMWTRATAGSARPKKKRRPTPSGWRWSSTKRPSGASCCCHGAGWSNAISHGHRGFGAW
jgi:hypothetical protein